MLNHAKRRRILAIDDDPILLELFQAFVTQDIYEVITAENGVIAVDLLMTEHFDLVVVDMRIPLVNGEQLIKFMRRAPKLRGLPIVVVTSFCDEDTREACLRTGANAFLSKPVDWGRLTALLEELTT